MTAGAHILVGAVIGSWALESRFKERIAYLLAASLAVASHFFLDSLPHQDFPFHFPPSWQELIINSGDVLFACLLISGLFNGKAKERILWWGAGFAILPDVISILKGLIWSPLPRTWLDRFHAGIQSHLINWFFEKFYG